MYLHTIVEKGKIFNTYIVQNGKFYKKPPLPPSKSEIYTPRLVKTFLNTGILKTLTADVFSSNSNYQND